MDCTSMFCPHSGTLCRHGTISSPARRFPGIVSHSSFLGFKLAQKPLSLSMRKARNCNLEVGGFSGSSPVTAPHQAFDVVIIGAGIIGLTIARQFLIGSDLSVAVVDQRVPCSGATGAGQGYLWMVHKTPGSDTWDLALRSHKLWEMLAESLQEQGLNPLVELGFKKTGSLLVGRNHAESDLLKQRVKQLSEAGLKAEYLSGSDLSEEEPALLVDQGSGAAFLPDDCQLDAHQTVAFIEKVNRHYSPKGRYAEFFNDPVKCLVRSGRNGEVEAVQTLKHTLYSKEAIIVAAGCWTGSLMDDLVNNLGVELHVPVRPRKGHLLVLENFNSLELNHGLMEAGYVDHQAATLPPPRTALAPSTEGRKLSISMTATLDARGNLLVGSSREFAGFNTDLDESIVNYIWKRAGEFFPKLKMLSLSNLSASRTVRIGLRPYMPDGRPVIGPVPGLPNVYLAAGHEGCGLSFALGTAEMITDMVLGHPGKIDKAPFAVQGRLIF